MQNISDSSPEQPNRDKSVDKLCAELPDSRPTEEAILAQLYDLSHRLQGWQNLVKQHDIGSIIIFDDIKNCTPPHQAHQLVGVDGYVRCLLPAVECALVAPTHVLVVRPPSLEEMRSTYQILQDLNGSQENLAVWLVNYEGGIVNLSELMRKDSAYSLLISEAASCVLEQAQDHPFVAGFEAIRGVIADPSGKPSFVWPFHVRDIHQELWATQIQSGSVILPTSSDSFYNKAEAYQLITEKFPGLKPNFTAPEEVALDRSQVSLGKVGVESVTSASNGECLQVTLADGRVVQIYRSLAPEFWEEKQNINPKKLLQFLESREQFRASSEAIIETALRREVEGIDAYIKSDAAGVSGLGNLPPHQIEYQPIYEGDFIGRVESLMTVLACKYGRLDSLPTAVVENCVARERDGFGVREYVVSGFFDEGSFVPWSITRAINNSNDVFEGVIGSRQLSRIGISDKDALRLIELVSLSAMAMGEQGYTLGPVSKDLMWDKNLGDFVIQDHNDRRGGRSSMERMLLTPAGQQGVWCDREYVFPVPEDTQPLDLAINLGKRALAQGMLVYSSPMMYYPKVTEEGTFVKLKIISEVPKEILSSPSHIIPQMETFVRGKLIE